MAFNIRTFSDSFTRPANTTAYADNDLVANDTDAGDVTPLEFSLGRGGFKVTNVLISKTDETDVANATFTLHLFHNEPTVANGDNGAISFDLAGYIGSVSLPTMVAATDEAYSWIQEGQTGFVGGLSGYTSRGVIYGLIQVEAAYSPASAEVFTVRLTVERD